jgi:hypothetical protein
VRPCGKAAQSMICNAERTSSCNRTTPAGRKRPARRPAPGAHHLEMPPGRLDRSMGIEPKPRRALSTKVEPNPTLAFDRQFGLACWLSVRGNRQHTALLQLRWIHGVIPGIPHQRIRGERHCRQGRRVGTVHASLYNRISLTPQTSTARMPHVGVGGSMVVESRKNGQFFRGIIWWDYLVGSTQFSRPPARPPVAALPRAPPRALGSGRHPAPHRGAPFAARSLFRCCRSTDRKPFHRTGLSVLAFFSSSR